MSVDTQEQIVTRFPEWPESCDLTTEHREQLEWWARNGEKDVLDSVDAQAAALMRPYPNSPKASHWPWPNSTWRTTGEGKEFLGNVMRFKKFLNGDALYPAGTEVLYTRDGVMSTMRVSRVDYDDSRLPYYLENLDGSGTRWVGRDAVLPIEPDTGAGAPSTEPEDERVRVLRQRLEVAEHRLSQAQADVTLVAEALANEARDRDWCSEYDGFVRRLSSRLQIMEFPAVERDYTVTWDETYTVTIRRSETYTAEGPDAATELAGEEGELTTSTSQWSGPFGVEIIDVNYHDADNYEAEEN